MTKAITVSTESELQDLVVESDSGGRKPTGIPAYIIFFVALLWSVFQLWIASPFPLYPFFAKVLHIPIINDTQARFIHLTFAIFLAFLAYPAFKTSPRHYIPAREWICAGLAVYSILYLLIFSDTLAHRIGLPTRMDLMVSFTGMVLLIEASRRTLGPPLMVMCLILLFYAFAGNLPIIPDVIAHKGQSFNKIASHEWLSGEGVFGVALAASASFVFLYVLFASLLDTAGAGNYFMQLSFALLGHMRGGPAKAAVLSSALNGVISGSSISNVVTGGMFTIPLMRRVGFSREKAGAVEVASSINGQLMPPVMGAAAFLIAEYVGISYQEVVKSSFIPAIISYLALLYIVHLEAIKINMPTLTRQYTRTWGGTLVVWGITTSSFIILSAIVYYGLGWIKVVFPHHSVLIICLVLFIAYMVALYYASRFPPLELDLPTTKRIVLPKTFPTFKTGIHYLLPVVILIWFLMVEKATSENSAFWACSFLIFIILTQRPLLAFFRKEPRWAAATKQGVKEFLVAMVLGARGMVAIAIATGASGIIVGCITLTGIGQFMTEFVEALSGGSFFLALCFTALISLVLGVGLPTTANYIVVASLMVQVIEDLGRTNGIMVPPIAIHLFVFYFGIMADVTPPVGLASYAAAAISGGNPIKTGFQGLYYSLRTAILPFFFIFNHELLLLGVDFSSWQGWVQAVYIMLLSTMGILLFAASTLQFLIVKNKIHETVVLFIVSFLLLQPSLWINFVIPPYKIGAADRIENIMGILEEGQVLKLHIQSEDFSGELKNTIGFVTVEGKGNGKKRLEAYGIEIDKEPGKVVVANVLFGSNAEKDGMHVDSVVTSIEMPQEQFSKQWLYAVAFLLFFVVWYNQRKRKVTESFIMN